MKKRSDNTIKYLILGVILVSMLFYLSQNRFVGWQVADCNNDNECETGEDPVNCPNDCLVDNDYLIKNDVGNMKFIASERYLGECRVSGSSGLNLDLGGSCNTLMAKYRIGTTDFDVNVEIKNTAFTNEEFLNAIKNSGLTDILIINDENSDNIGGRVIVYEEDTSGMVGAFWFNGQNIINLEFTKEPESGEEEDLVGLINAYLDKYPSEVVDNCVDSDNGKNYYLGGRAETTFRTEPDTCVSYGPGPIPVGTSGTLKLYETYCEDDGDFMGEYKKCEYGCIEDENNQDSCRGDGTLFTCTDSDDGLNYTQRGTVTAGTFVQEDYCAQDGDLLLEWSCADNGAFELNDRLCRCQDGVCVGTISDGVLIEEDIGELKIKSIYVNDNWCKLSELGLSLPGSCKTSHAMYIRNEPKRRYDVMVEQRDVSFTQEEFMAAVEGYVDGNGNNFVSVDIAGERVYLLDSTSKTILWNSGNNIIYLNGDNIDDLDEIAREYLEKYPSDLVAEDPLSLQVNVYNGWNLIFGLEHPSQVGTDEVKDENIKAIYVLLPSQEYVRLYPDIENDKLTNVDKPKLKNGAFWVYANKTGLMNYNIGRDGLVPFDQRSMHVGWNFVGVSPDILNFNARIMDLAGDCNIERSYYFDPQTQGWVTILLDDTYNRLLEVNGYGVVLKMSANCQMGPPPLPPE